MQQQRSRIIMGVLSLGLLAGAALTGSPVQAVDAVGPYYALPSWDRKMAPANRFVVLTDWILGAVLDKETGLVWELSPDTTTYTWDEARLQCTKRRIGNRQGWRLPSMHEYASLVVPPNQHPALPPGHPFINIQTDVSYWSATTHAAIPTGAAWYMFFDIGFLNFGDKTTPNHVWCVRGSNNLAKY